MKNFGNYQGIYIYIYIYIYCQSLIEALKEASFFLNLYKQRPFSLLVLYLGEKNQSSKKKLLLLAVKQCHSLRIPTKMFL